MILRKLADRAEGSDITDAYRPTSQSQSIGIWDAFESKLNDLDDVIDENVKILSMMTTLTSRFP